LHAVPDHHTPDGAFSIVLKARQLDGKVEETDPDSGSNPSNDSSVDALEFGAAGDALHELNSAISDVNDDKQRDLIAPSDLVAVTSHWANGTRPGRRPATSPANGPRGTSPGFPWSVTILRMACPSSINPVEDYLDRH